MGWASSRDRLRVRAVMCLDLLSVWKQCGRALRADDQGDAVVYLRYDQAVVDEQIDILQIY